MVLTAVSTSYANCRTSVQCQTNGPPSITLLLIEAMALCAVRLVQCTALSLSMTYAALCQQKVNPCHTSIDSSSRAGWCRLSCGWLFRLFGSAGVQVMLRLVDTLKATDIDPQAATDVYSMLHSSISQVKPAAVPILPYDCSLLACVYVSACLSVCLCVCLCLSGEAASERLSQ